MLGAYIWWNESSCVVLLFLQLLYHSVFLHFLILFCFIHCVAVFVWPTLLPPAISVGESIFYCICSSLSYSKHTYFSLLCFLILFLFFLLFPPCFSHACIFSVLRSRCIYAHSRMARSPYVCSLYTYIFPSFPSSYIATGESNTLSTSAIRSLLILSPYFPSRFPVRHITPFRGSRTDPRCGSYLRLSYLLRRLLLMVSSVLFFFQNPVTGLQFPNC